MKRKIENLNRRQFLKLSAASATVSVIGFPIIIPSRVLGASAPGKLIQIGQIGCGRIASDMDMPGVLKHPNLARVVAVAEFDSKRSEWGRQRVEQAYAKATGQTSGVKAYNDYHE